MKSQTKYENQKPWSIQIELTEGCNRRCRFCGIHSLYRDKRDETYKFMDPKLAEDIAKNLGEWLPKVRIEFAMQGEPLLNRNAQKIFQSFRTYFSRAQLMCTTNADPLREAKGFNEQKIWMLFKCGLNMLVCDYYGEKFDPSYKDFFNEIKKAAGDIPVLDFFKDSPTVWGYESPRLMKIVVIDNTVQRNFWRNLNNQAGNTPPDYYPKERMPKVPMLKRCHLPFREMAIKHDGTVAMCCMDWQREALVGHFPEQSYEDIWNSDGFRWIRSLLFQKRRDMMTPCDRCDYHPVKVGLVQDPYPEGHPEIKYAAKAVRDLQTNMKHLSNRYVDNPFRYV